MRNSISAIRSKSKAKARENGQLPDKITKRRFFYFVTGLGFYLICVILWGAFVRATGSGAGCGGSWPLCNGEVIPQSPQLETLIEFTHRVTSGIAFVLVVVLFLLAVRIWPKGHRVRRYAFLSLLFMITEALLGASLVVFGLTGDDASTSRAWVVAFHLVNTLVLLGCVVLTAFWVISKKKVLFFFQKGLVALLGVCLASLALVGATGAIAALGDTLFPSESLVQGIEQDFSTEADLLLRLRVVHPLLAALSALLIVGTAGIVTRMRPRNPTPYLALSASLLVFAEVVIGIFNLFFLAPIWLQLVHLFFADLTWIATLLFAVSALRDRREREPTSSEWLLSRLKSATEEKATEAR
jgi:heme A synthase